MKLERSCGILLHITSLPGRYGTGTLGPEAYEFVDLLHAAGQSFWQVLPVGPVTGALGYSPYSSASTFAGNALLISLEKLREKSWFSCDAGQAFPDEDFCDFDGASAFKLPLLRQACADFFAVASRAEQDCFTSFCTEHGDWLDDYALFAALADHFGTNCWSQWEPSIAHRTPAAIKTWRRRLQDQVRFQAFLQFLFLQQWLELKAYCSRLGIGIIGDIPIYVDYDSADAWAHRDIFQLDLQTLEPEAMAGVPPDYFSKTGQLWGNPLYRWFGPDRKIFAPTLAWWIRRIRHLCKLFDITRIDHFRGFESYWAVPAGETTAVKGAWKPGPGKAFFRQIEEQTGPLQLIAEDLGTITPAVIRLREALHMPGMKVLQFAFDGTPRNPYLPHNYRDANCIVYTGTHDNNTTNGWFYGPETQGDMRCRIMDYMGIESQQDFHRHAIRLAYGSVAELAIAPAQDVLGYGEKLRMNTPGIAGGNNWRWKLLPGRFNEQVAGWLRHLAGLYDRLPAPKAAQEQGS